PPVSAELSITAAEPSLRRADSRAGRCGRSHAGGDPRRRAAAQVCAPPAVYRRDQITHVPRPARVSGGSAPTRRAGTSSSGAPLGPIALAWSAQGPSGQWVELSRRQPESAREAALL